MVGNLEMMVQGSLAPVFVGPEGVDWTCRECGHLLAKSCPPRALIAVAIQCFICGQVTSTPQWESDEPLPRVVLSLGESEARYRIGSSLEIQAGDTIAPQAEIDRIEQLTGIRPDLKSQLDLTPNGLSAMERWLGDVLPGFKSAMGTARRARSVGNKKHRNCLIAWAILHLGERLAAPQIDANEEDLAAIACLQLAGNLIRRWQHHALFRTISPGLVHEYPHAMAQLVTASWLADAGNPVGLTKLPENGRSPDLFVNHNSAKKIEIEVKAPVDLQWPHHLPD